jgi:hypothetical protein
MKQVLLSITAAFLVTVAAAQNKTINDPNVQQRTASGFSRHPAFWRNSLVFIVGK